MKRNGVWQRAPRDWAWRVEVPGYGSLAGLGCTTRAEARAARRSVKADAERKVLIALRSTRVLGPPR